LLGPNGEQFGIVSSQEAYNKALDMELDLVKIAPAAKPPVCKIMNYGKSLYEQAKREKEAKKNQRVMELKEIRLSMNIEEHDFETKRRNAVKFLTKGDKIKVIIRLKGREMAHAALAVDIMNKFADALGENANLEKKPVQEGRAISMILAPKPVAAANAKKVKPDKEKSENENKGPKGDKNIIDTKENENAEN